MAAPMAKGEGQQNLPGAQAKREQTDGEGVVTQAVYIVRPHGEHVVSVPMPAFPLDRRDVIVV